MDRLSTRLVVFVLVLGAILVGSLAAGALYWTRELLERDLERALERETRTLRDWVVRDFQKDARELPPDLADELAQALSSTECQGRLLGPDGREIFSSREPVPPGALERVESFRIGSRGPYVFRVTRSTASVGERLADLGLFLAVLAPVALALAGLLAWVVFRRTLAPIDVVRLEAEQISRTNVSHRIEERWTSGEVRDLVHTFNAMLGRLESAFEDLNSFAADAAHELRTPLATLRAEIETAIQRSPSIEEYEEMLRSFQTEVSRMNRVVTDLFMLARMERGQHALEMERMHLAPLVEETVETWTPVAQARGIRIRALGGDAEIRGNAGALRRVLMNLVENAVKYNRDGGDVSISIERRGIQAVLRIADTGIGIAPEHLGRIFQRFFRADRARSRESGGAGLGLAICKSFVACHGGTISVSSTPGEGTAFTVELPIDEGPGRPRPDAGAGPALTSDGLPALGTGAPLPGGRIR